MGWFKGYIKTKNILVSYITHIVTDIFGFAVAIMGLEFNFNLNSLKLGIQLFF